MKKALAITAALLAGGCLPAWATAPPQPQHLRGQVLAQGWHDEPVVILDAATGEPQRRLGRTDEARAFAAGDGVLYAVAGHDVWAQRITDGKELWRHVNEAGRYHSIVAQDEERLYLIRAPASGRHRERLVALRRGDGHLIWSTVLDGLQMWRTPSRAPVLAGGLVVASADRALVAFDRRTGRPRWRVDTQDSPQWLVADGRAAYAVADERLIAVSLQSGMAEWSLPINVWRRNDPWPMAAPAAATAGRIVLRQGDRLVAIDATTTQRLWTGPIIEGAVFGESVAFVKLEGNRHGLVDMHDGSLRWTLSFDDEIASPPRLDEQDGLVLLRPDDDELFAYDLAQGRRRWVAEL